MCSWQVEYLLFLRDPMINQCRLTKINSGGKESLKQISCQPPGSKQGHRPMDYLGLCSICRSANQVCNLRIMLLGFGLLCGFVLFVFVLFCCFFFNSGSAPTDSDIYIRPQGRGQVYGKI